MRLGLGLDITNKKGVPFVAEYQTVYDSFTTPPSVTVAAAQNTMVTTLVNNSIWVKLDFFHLEGGHTDGGGESKTNWVTPGTKDLYVSAGAPNFLAYNGFKGDGSTDLMKNSYVFNGAGKYKQDDASLGVYIMENIQESASEIGVNSAVDNYIRARYAVNQVGGRFNDATTLGNTKNSTSEGLTMYSRPAAGIKKLYKNGILFGSATTASTGVPDAECNFLGTSATKSTKRQGCAFGGSGMDETDVKIIADAVNDFFKTVSTNKWTTANDIVLIGDKESQYDKTDSDDVDYSALFKYPVNFICTGDYAEVAKSISDELFLYKGYSGVNKIFSAWGNHDGTNDATGGQFKTFFNQNKTYYSEVIGSVEFFFYDTLLKFDETGWDSMGDAQSRTVASVKASTQGQWLINAMASSSCIWKVLVYHIPTWGSNHNLNTSPQMAWDWYSYGVDLILNGHFHFYERLLVNTGTGNVPIINVGTSGATQLTIGTPATGSLVRISSATDADFASGMFTTMNESATQLSFNLNSVDNSRNVTAGKDTLVLSK